MRVLNRNKMAAGVIALTVLLTAGVAVALWSADGSGDGGARAISAQTLTVSASTGTADLYPGFTNGDVYFNVTNPNPYGVSFTGMTPGTVTSSSPSACPASNVTVSSASSLAISVAANATNAARSIADVVSMSSNAPDGCQGVTFTIGLTLTGTQV